MAKYKRKRTDPGYDEACRIVRKRDKNTCQMPGCKKRKKIEVHHIIKYSKNPYLRVDPMNMICLCAICHKQVTNKETFYAPLLQKIVNDNTT